MKYSVRHAVFSSILLAFLASSASAQGDSSMAGRVKSLFRDLFYDQPSAAGSTAVENGNQAQGQISQNSTLAPQQSGQALVIARIADPSVPREVADKIVQQFLSKVSGGGIKFVSLEDLTGTSGEAAQGKAAEGSMRSFASDQQALQFASSQGIPAVLSLSLEAWNVRPAQTASGLFLGDARGTASLVSAAEGVRSQSADFSATARSFNEKQLAEKLLQQLASGLATQVNSWQPPQAATNASATCEVHAKVDGLIMPAFSMQNGVPQFTAQTIPVYASGASVELDGVLAGQTPCSITASRGMHEIKISREGLKTYSAVINLTGQNRYDITLSPTEETLAKFNEQMAYLRKLHQDEKLNEADIKVLEGYAKMLRQSGYRIDQRKVSDWSHLSVDKDDAAKK